MEKVELKIKEPLWVGFCLGVGLGLALIMYGVISLFAAKMYLDAVLRPPARQAISYRPSPQPDSRYQAALENFVRDQQRRIQLETGFERRDQARREVEEMYRRYGLTYDPNKWWR